MVTLALGVAALMVSAGAAWMLSHFSRERRSDGAGFIIAVSILLVLVGIVLCYFGVSALVGV
jgi:hypothetical protein